MTPMPRDDATLLMSSATGGDTGAAARLLPLVYDQLRKAAQLQLDAERPGHTLSATALVHDAYIRLAGTREVPWAGRKHFYAAAAEAMRRILIDHARAKYGRTPVSRDARRRALGITGLGTINTADEADGLIALDDSLSRLEGVDPGAAAVVRLRFYAGLDIEQTALTLGVSASTVKRDWAFARGWLHEDLERQREQ